MKIFKNNSLKIILNFRIEIKTHKLQNDKIYKIIKQSTNYIQL